jgi:predicted amidohydrolase
MLKLSFFQYCPIFNQVQANFDNISQLLEDNCTQINESDIVVFPEYFLSGSLDLNHFEDYKAQTQKISPYKGGVRKSGGYQNLEQALCQLSKKYPSTTFVFGSVLLPINTKNTPSLRATPQEGNLESVKFANTSLAILDGQILARYNKKALIYNENYTCTATLDYPVFEVKNIKIGLAICWDTILPEVFRHYVNRVDLVIVPAFWGIGGNALQSQYSHSLEKTYYRQLLTVRAYENAFATVFVNSVGAYQSPFYTDRMMGGSLAVMPPLGEVFFTNSKKPNELHTIELDFEHLHKYREFYATGQDYEYYKSQNRF